MHNNNDENNLTSLVATLIPSPEIRCFKDRQLWTWDNHRENPAGGGVIYNSSRMYINMCNLLADDYVSVMHVIRMDEHCSCPNIDDMVGSEGGPLEEQ